MMIAFQKLLSFTRTVLVQVPVHGLSSPGSQCKGSNILPCSIPVQLILEKSGTV
jgi:hypothetical protein